MNSYIFLDPFLNHWWDSWRAWCAQQVDFMSTPPEWPCVLWCSHGIFRLYGLFLNLTIISGENNEVHCRYITGYASRFSYIQLTSSIAFLIREIKQISAYSFPLSSQLFLANQEEATGSHLFSYNEQGYFASSLSKKMQFLLHSLFYNREMRMWRYSRQKVRRNWG